LASAFYPSDIVGRLVLDGGARLCFANAFSPA